MTVDIVYTWVDGDDPEWLHQKLAALDGESGSTRSGAAHSARFSDNGELRYSLRSIHAFAPWVNRIHIVTNGQKPNWLNTDHPKINLVTHRDIFQPVDLLPTFSSRAIEARLANIPGLSDYFVYFNDDMFLGRRSSVRDFFCREKPRVFTTTRTPLKRVHANLRGGQPGSLHHDGITHTRTLVESTTGRPVGYEMRHQVVPYVTKAAQHLADEVYRTHFDAAGQSRFRAPGQMVAPQCFMMHMMAAGKAKRTYLRSVRSRASWKDIIYKLPHVKASMYIDLQEGCEPKFERVSALRPLLFCVNQTESTTEVAVNAAAAFLESYFPNASPFEKITQV